MGLNREEKVKLVEGTKDEYGLNRSLEVIGLPKSVWYYQQKAIPWEERYKEVKKDLEQAINENPAYGYRKLKVELEDSFGHVINHKVLKKLLRVWELALPRAIKRPRLGGVLKLIQSLGARANLLVAILDPEPFEVVVTDFTEIVYNQGKDKLEMIAFEDLGSKLVLGYATGESQDTELALKAWDEAKIELKRRGISLEEVVVHQDQDSVFTGYGYTGQLALRDKVALSFTAKGTPGENAAKESFIGHFKTENRSLFLEAKTREELEGLIEERVVYYNRKRRHQSLGYASPEEFLNK